MHTDTGGEAGTASPPLTLVGDLVALGPGHEGLLPLLWRWENDLELSILTGDPVSPLAASGSTLQRYVPPSPDRAAGDLEAPEGDLEAPEDE